MTTTPTKAEAETTGVCVGLRTNERTPTDPAVAERAAAMLPRHPRPWQAIPFLTIVVGFGVAALLLRLGLPGAFVPPLALSAAMLPMIVGSAILLVCLE